MINAGKVLFADDLIQDIQMAIFATETKLTFLDIDQVFGNIFELIEIGEGYIRKNIKWPVNFKSGSMERVEIPEIPLEAIREAIINSLIHRDFKNPKSNEVAIYKDRVEIFNPGEFPEGFKPEDFIEGQGSIPRNPLIANTLYLSKDIEKWGSGFRRITEACADANVKVKFEIRKNGFMVIFYRKTDEELYDLTQNDKNDAKNVALNDENVAKSVALKLKEKYPELRKVYIDIIDAIAKNNYITQEEIASELNKTRNSIYRNIKTLKDMGILERLGSKKKGYWKVNV